MAYTNSIFNALQTELSQVFQSQDLREGDYGATEKLIQNAPSLAPNLETNERGRFIIDPQQTNQTEAEYFKRSTAAVSNSISYDHSGSAGSSDTLSLSWKAYSRNFAISKKRNMRNFLGSQIFENEIKNARLDLLAEIEADNIAYLEAQKSQVNDIGTTNLNGVAFDGATYISKVDKAQEDRVFAILKKMMQYNDYKGVIDFVHDYNFGILGAEFLAQGSQNADNLAYQVLGNMNYMEAQIDAVSGYDAVGYMFPAGSVASVMSVPHMNREGEDIGTEVWGIIPDPKYSFDWGFHAKLSGSDDYQAQDLGVEYQLFTFQAQGKAPLSTTNETVIQKVGLLDA
jgi:hypothetical protein